MGVCLYHINPAERRKKRTTMHRHNFPHTHTHFLLPVLPPFRTPVWIHPVPSGGRRRGDLVASTGTVNGVRRDPTYPASKQRANVLIWDDR